MEEKTEIKGEYVYKLYEESHIPLLVSFLAIYLFYIGVSSIVKSNVPGITDKQIHTAFDVFVAVLLIAYLVYVYSDLSSLQKSNSLQLFWNWCLDFYANENMILASTVFILVFYFIVFCFKITIHSSPYSLHILEQKAWIFLLSLILVFVINRVFETDIIRYLYLTDDNQRFIDTRFKYWGDKSGRASVVETPDSDTTDATDADADATAADAPTQPKEEVFNLTNNKYTYEDAKYACKAHGARLASYDEVEDAYKKGGEWCNYGWTDGQMVLFPTQKSTWESLQKDDKTKQSCGRPGINGGHINNPAQKFGVNCYGVKPEKRDVDITGEAYLVPTGAGAPSPLDEDHQKKLEFWKKFGNDINRIHSFNRNQWSYV